MNLFKFDLYMNLSMIQKEINIFIFDNCVYSVCVPNSKQKQERESLHSLNGPVSKCRLKIFHFFFFTYTFLKCEIFKRFKKNGQHGDELIITANLFHMAYVLLLGCSSSCIPLTFFTYCGFTCISSSIANICLSSSIQIDNCSSKCFNTSGPQYLPGSSLNTTIPSFWLIVA